MAHANVLNDNDDNLPDPDVPEDGRQAWLSLLAIGLIAGASTTVLYAVVSLLAT